METFLVLGIVLLVNLIVIRVVVSLALFAWLRHLWRRLRRSPAVSQIARRAATAGQVLPYRDLLSQAPPAAAELTLHIRRKALALESITDELAPKERFRVAQITRRYLPDTMNAYRPPLAGADDQSRKVAQQLVLEQLSQLETNLDRIAVGGDETGIAALQTNGLFIESISQQPAEDLRLPDQRS